MRRVVLLLLVLGFAGALAGAARAQGKDPFRPPPVAGAPGGGTSDVDPPPPGAPPGIPAVPDDGLSRTGQNLGALLGLGMGFLLLGSALRLAARGFGSGGRGGWSAPNRPGGGSTGTLPYA
jgi:hypothetical protein